MNTTEYKGFNIVEQQVGARINKEVRFFISAHGGYSFGNIKGYATLNTAKGAITKYLKEQEQSMADVVAVHDKLEERSIISGGDLTDYASVMPKPVQQSRNKREGKFDGFINGRNKRVPQRYRDLPAHAGSFHCVAKTRKQRKSALRIYRQTLKEMGLAPLTMLQWVR